MPDDPVKEVHRGDIGEQSVQLLSLRPAADRLGISPYTLRTMSRYRRLVPYVRVGRRLLFDVRDLDDFVQRHRVPALEDGARPRTNLAAHRNPTESEPQAANRNRRRRTAR